ncbi:AraC family transcriptional regulator [Rhodocaloribacter litoris]|uniref:helix-turn-helix domain-containing protein n=1 Tax=Rhodocaloribacter litoris TaxID=2558931 RepID=UPI0014220A4D|nr:AraC family transcriptional regulator [Rhodocaloribacter litoris]QXD16219.1 AraC family transcriptional regulator [Rhodocaloribacter litoris]
MISLYTEQRHIQAVLHETLAELRRAGREVDLPVPVRKALAYIHEHLFEETLDVAAVCRHCGLNNHNISSRFKRHVGLGMRRYIERGRLEAAKRLLHHPELSILQIAWAVGYAYPESFARAFKRYTGCTATTYRARLLRRNGKTTRDATLQQTAYPAGRTYPPPGKL